MGVRPDPVLTLFAAVGGDSNDARRLGFSGPDERALPSEFWDIEPASFISTDLVDGRRWALRSEPIFILSTRLRGLVAEV